MRHLNKASRLFVIAAVLGLAVTACSGTNRKVGSQSGGDAGAGPGDAGGSQSPGGASGTDCEHEGEAYPNGSSYTTNHGCTYCECVDGEWDCLTADCNPVGGSGGAAGSVVGGAGGTGPGGGAGSDEGTGGATAGASSGGLMTTEQWEALTAPQPGEHAVLTSGCDGAPIGQEYRILPTVGCALAPDYDYETNPVRDCTVEPFCSGPEDCQEEPFGSCRGFPYAYCDYGLEREPCTTDADCSTLTGGHCATSGSNESLCFPTGECVGPEPTCFYPEESCTNDSSCTQLPGGRCEKVIRFARCSYDLCTADADCPGTDRCACSELSEQNECVSADCSEEADCEDGEECRLERGCYGSVVAYHCSTSADTCRTAADCDGLHCSYADEHWQCVELDCPYID